MVSDSRFSLPLHSPPLPGLPPEVSLPWQPLHHHPFQVPGPSLLPLRTEQAHLHPIPPDSQTASDFQTPKPSDLQTPRPPEPQNLRPPEPSDPHTLRPPQTLRLPEPPDTRPSRLPDPQSPRPSDFQTPRTWTLRLPEPQSLRVSGCRVCHATV